MPDGRVLIAAGHPWAATPSWTRYDELPNCRCPGWELTTGRSSVFETTDVGTATVHFEDRNRTLDTDSLMGRAIQLQIRDPVTGIWQPSFRGTVDEATHDVYPLTAGLVSTVQLRCVDMFAWLARVEMTPTRFGHPPTHGNEGSITFGEQKVDDRIRSLLFGVWTDEGGISTQGGANIPPEMCVVFTGNVICWDVAYDPGESVLTGLRDAADAEMPGIANIYVDRHGRFCFHGRVSRFDPDLVDDPFVEWDFQRWAAGDGDAIAASPSSTAQLRELSYSRQSSLIYNAAIAWPKFLPGTKTGSRKLFPEKQKDDQVRFDTTSISNEGYRALPPMGDLLIKQKFTAPAADGKTECQRFADYYVTNYSSAHKAINTATIKSVRPTDPRAAATWALLTRIDISDILGLHVGAAGLVGDEFFVEGLSKSVRVLSPEYDLVELTPNLGSVARYAYNPWG